MASHPESVTVSRKRMELATVKEYLDEYFTEKIMLEKLALQSAWEMRITSAGCSARWKAAVQENIGSSGKNIRHSEKSLCSSHANLIPRSHHSDELQKDL